MHRHIEADIACQQHLCVQKKCNRHSHSHTQTWTNVFIIILYAYVACRANTMDFHLSLSFASKSISSMDFPSSFASFNIVLLHVSLGRPLHLLPLSGVHLADILVMLFGCFPRD